ncbi:hypothetical protein BIW11_07955, partial [Tropilaelaps mercedesae]
MLIIYVQIAGKRKGLMFIPKFRAGRGPTPPDSTSADITDETKIAEEMTQNELQDRDDDQTKSSEAEVTDVTKRRGFGAPWRRRKNVQGAVKPNENKGEQRKQSETLQEDDQQDSEEDEVGRITGAQQSDDREQSAVVKAAITTNDEAKPQRSWNRFKFGNRRQSLQEKQKEPEDTTAQNTADSQRLSTGAQAVSEALQRARAIADRDRQQEQMHQQHVQIMPVQPLQTSAGDDSQGPFRDENSETRLQVEQDIMAERPVPEEKQDDTKVFVSRLFIDRFLIQRQHAPLPSSPPSAFMTRSVAAKPSPPAEIYGSCLARAGRAAQGLLGGLCLFLLLLLLAADDDE